MKRDLRIVECYENDCWVPTNFQDLVEGEIFRMFNAPNEPVIDNKGEKEWLCISNPYLNTDNIWQIDCY